MFWIEKCQEKNNKMFIGDFVCESIQVKEGRLKNNEENREKKITPLFLY